jgi:hypothetical protein
LIKNYVYQLRKLSDFVLPFFTLYVVVKEQA